MHRLAVAVALVALLAAPVASAAPSPKLHVIFGEGLTVHGMVDRVAAVRRIAIRKRHVTPFLTGTAFAKAVAAARPPSGFGRATSMEGFLFPDTYEFGPATRAPEIVAMQQRRFAQQWAMVRLPAGRKPYDALIVAPMAERETAAPEERPLVAAVIWNRLAKGIPPPTRLEAALLHHGGGGLLREGCRVRLPRLLGATDRRSAGVADACRRSPRRDASRRRCSARAHSPSSAGAACTRGRPRGARARRPRVPFAPTRLAGRRAGGPRA